MPTLVRGGDGVQVTSRHHRIIRPAFKYGAVSNGLIKVRRVTAR